MIRNATTDKRPESGHKPNAVDKSIKIGQVKRQAVGSDATAGNSLAGRDASLGTAGNKVKAVEKQAKRFEYNVRNGK